MLLILAAFLCAFFGLLFGVIDAGELEILRPLEWFVLGILFVLLAGANVTWPWVRRTE
ncbi:MAG TPA: hypothetical protein VFQ40_04790 [Actinomycetota bacterium]|nr:hypothetical protein [Actinomycetota bacterium]